MKKILFVFILFIALLLNAQNFSNIKIYVFDNDDGLLMPNPDDLGQTNIGYEQNIISALEDLGFSNTNGNLVVEDTIPILAKNGKEVIDDYAAIFVICGHRSASDSNLLTSDEINSLDIYLQNGGCVYMEGNNIAEFLSNNYPLFLNTYFNAYLIDPGSDQVPSGYDTIITDTASHFGFNYEFVFMPNTVVDLGNDIIGPYDDTIPEPYYYRFLVFDDPNGKLYKTTASAYAPPAEKNSKVSQYKTVLQTVSTGAFADITRENGLSQAENNQLIRDSYISDILDFFTLGQTLVINRTTDPNDTLLKTAYESVNIDINYMFIPYPNTLPDYNTLMNYQSVMIYTGEETDIFTQSERNDLMMYLNNGGKLFLIGENIAQEYGVQGYSVINEDSFLVKYLGIDFINESPDINDGLQDPYPSGIYNKYSTIQLDKYFSPDVLFPAFQPYPNIASRTFYFSNTTKANDSIISGIQFENNTHKAMTFSFILQSDPDTFLVYDIINTTLVDFFDYDTEYTPLEYYGSTTLNYDINISYKQLVDYILFNVSINSLNNGSIELWNNNIMEDKIVISKNNYYKLKSKESYGTFTIIVKDKDNKILDSKIFNIKPLNNYTVKIWTESNRLFILSNEINNMEILDITGKKVFSSQLKEGLNEIYLFKEFTKGIYFIKINDKIKKVYKL